MSEKGTRKGRPYGGVPADERQAERRARIVEAAVAEMDELGVPETTVGGICARAGLTKRYFYESFDDIDALLDAILQEAIQQVMARAFAATARAERPVDAAGEVFGTMLEFGQAHPARSRVFFRELDRPGGHLRSQRQLLLQLTTQLIRRLWKYHADGSEPDDDEALIASVALAGAGRELMLNWLDGDLDVRPEQLVAHMTHLVTTSLHQRSVSAPHAQ